MRNLKREAKLREQKLSPYDFINALRGVILLDPIPGTGPLEKKRTKSKKRKNPVSA
jgi:hypothetical protein